VAEQRYVGGQAVIEGVMMRGERTWAVAVRRPDGGIEVAVNDTPGWSDRWSKFPLARGVVTLAESVSLGMKALSFAAAASPDDEEKPGKGEMAGGIVMALVLFVGLFILAPALLARASGFRGSIAFNAFEGAIRIALFLGYIIAIGRVPDIRRVFEYHGAEHKSIAAYENGVELTTTNAQRFSTEHVRCGTNFLLTVMVLTIVCYSVFGRPGLALLLLSRAVLIPVIAGLAYELIRLAARNMHRRWVRALMRPGLLLQRLTTREPSDDQVEVALTALRAALTAEQLAEVEARTAA
jgi:uncharacterized protein YqhQ